MLEKCLAEGFTLQILLMSFSHISGTAKARDLVLIKEYCLYIFLHPFSLYLVICLAVMVKNFYKFVFQSKIIVKSLS